MKIRNLVLSLTLAGLGLNQAAAQGTYPSAPPAGRHVGDGVRSVGDSSSYAASTPDVRPTEFRTTTPTGGYIDNETIVDMKMLAPTASHGTGANHYTQSASNSSSLGWFSTEALLWFGEKNRSPAMLTTAGTGVQAIAGANGVNTLFGGNDGSDRGLQPGYRVSWGMYLDDCEKVAVAGRVYGLFTTSSSEAANSDATTSIGLPVYNSATNNNDAFQVAFFDGGVNGRITGNASVESELQMFGSDSSLHLLLGRANDHRADLLVGYTYNRLKDSLGVGYTSTNNFTGDAIPDGTIFQGSDLFESTNEFHGGHIGVLSSVTRSKLSLSTLAKISFGNMHQTRRSSGSRTEEFNSVVTPTADGFYSPSSYGSSRDEFAFIPELGIKLGYAVRDNLDFTVGYTFMFWSSVAMAGDQVGGAFDPASVTAGGVITRPPASDVSDSFWMQGIDLGLNWRF
ncbi:BBP7 family outer membrane beta-barrel protein [Aureliella helgolandensis]|uniref:Outer membrane protein transport protein (OMPP1/FadL/TodX) n=1 Tax=Aureliella helgolandensis TaxID=2527968 RepID=A0A518G783_9BACT|nr:BBP7 family outer membrane beta-barrel protein [Aureliella helgolandensis]QDV24443.1 hypothetical protein Q31a_27610 [Aureliella helgolandensis]